MITQAVVPAAGEGTRLRPLTETRPKALLEVAGKPILTRCFEQLQQAGIETVVVVVGYRAGDIVSHYGDSHDNLDLQYVHQRDRRGLGEAVLLTESYITEEFFLVNGDNVFDPEFDFTAFIDHHEERSTDVTALAERVSRQAATTTGVFEPVDEDSLEDSGPFAVSGMVEKSAEPPSRFASAGCYVLPTEIFRACGLVRPSATGEYELATAIDILCSAGAAVEALQFGTFGDWRMNINSPSDLERATRRLQGL